MRHHAARSEMWTSVNPEQPEKAELPMLVTPFGIVIEDNPEHP